MSCEIFIEQNLGPHIEQKWAVFPDCFGKVSSWIKKKHPYLSETSYVYIPTERVQDIDTNEDWKRAQILLKILKNRWLKI